MKSGELPLREGIKELIAEADAAGLAAPTHGFFNGFSLFFNVLSFFFCFSTFFMVLKAFQGDVALRVLDVEPGIGRMEVGGVLHEQRGRNGARQRAKP